MKIATRLKAFLLDERPGRCGHDTGGVQPGHGSRVGERLRFPRWIDRSCGRAGRHLHAAVQHRPDRGDAGVVPREPARRTAGRRSTATIVGVYAATLLRRRAGPLAALRDPVRSARAPPGHAVRARLRRGRGGPHRADDATCHPRRRRACSRARRRAASIPSILGFIAAGDRRQRGAARQGGRPLRGRDPGRDRGRVRRRAASCSRSSARRVLPERGVLWRLVPDLPAAASRITSRRAGGPDGRGARARRVDSRRYGDLLRTSHVWLLAPTWIAVNASIGLWFSQSIFQFSKATRGFPTRSCMRGFSANQITLAAIVDRRASSGPACIYWGNRFKTMRRTTIILLRDRRWRACSCVAGLAVNHSGRPAARSCRSAGGRGRRRRPVRPGRRDARGPRAARRHLRALSRRPRRDHGALLGVPRDRPDHRGLIGGVAADWRGIDGMLLATMSLLLASRVVPLARLRTRSTIDRRTGTAGVRRRAGSRMTDGRPWAPVPLARGAQGAVVAPHHLATEAGLGDPARRRHGRGRGDRHERRPRRGHAQRLRDRR